MNDPKKRQAYNIRTSKLSIALDRAINEAYDTFPDLTDDDVIYCLINQTKSWMGFKIREQLKSDEL